MWSNKLKTREPSQKVPSLPALTFHNARPFTARLKYCKMVSGKKSVTKQTVNNHPAPKILLALQDRHTHGSRPLQFQQAQQVLPSIPTTLLVMMALTSSSLCTIYELSRETSGHAMHPIPWHRHLLWQSITSVKMISSNTSLVRHRKASSTLPSAPPPHLLTFQLRSSRRSLAALTPILLTYGTTAREFGSRLQPPRNALPRISPSRILAAPPIMHYLLVR